MHVKIKPRILGSENPSLRPQNLRLQIETTPCALTKGEIPRPPIRLGRRRKSTGGGRDAIRRTPMLVLLVPRPLESMQRTIPVRRNASNKTLVRSLAGTVIKRGTIQKTARSLQSQKTSNSLGELRVDD